MGTISKSKTAPDGTLNITIANEEFSVGESGYETDKLEILEAAAMHPFLEVDFDTPKAETGELEQISPDRKVLKKEETRAARNAEKDATDVVAVPPQPEEPNPTVAATTEEKDKGN